jgi:hypothetical protein
MTPVYASFAGCVVVLSILRGADPLRAVQRGMLVARACWLYLTACAVVIRREHVEMWRWATERARQV